jgi:hypothetical protein
MRHDRDVQRVVSLVPFTPQMLPKFPLVPLSLEETPLESLCSSVLLSETPMVSLSKVQKQKWSVNTNFNTI